MLAEDVVGDNDHVGMDDHLVPSKNISATRRAPTISTIPTEIQEQIFGYLTLCSAICIGLTCRKFYLIHRSLHDEKMSLYEEDKLPEDPLPLLSLYQRNWTEREWRRRGRPLCIILQPWMWTSARLIWGECFGLNVFITEERWQMEKKKLLKARKLEDEKARNVTNRLDWEGWDDCMEYIGEAPFEPSANPRRKRQMQDNAMVRSLRVTGFVS